MSLPRMEFRFVPHGVGRSSLGLLAGTHFAEDRFAPIRRTARAGTRQFGGIDRHQSPLAGASILSMRIADALNSAVPDFGSTASTVRTLVST